MPPMKFEVVVAYFLHICFSL